MFYFGCAQFRRGLDITCFKPNSCFNLESFSLKDKSLPASFVEQCLMFCNHCSLCTETKADIIWELKRYVLLILGYITCLSGHGCHDSICIRRVMYPLTLPQRQASLWLFGRQLTKNCPRRLANFTERDITLNMLVVIKRLPTLDECLQFYSMDFFSKRHLLSREAFQPPFKINRAMFENLIRPYFYSLFEENTPLLNHFLFRLKTYFRLLLGITFKTHCRRKVIASMPYYLTATQQHIYLVNKLYELLLPENEFL